MKAHRMIAKKGSIRMSNATQTNNQTAQMPPQVNGLSVWFEIPVTDLGETFDCGSKLGFLEANLKLGLAHRETGAEFAKMIKALDL